MKKNLFLGFIAFAAMAVTSCTNDEMNEFIPQGKAIEFGTYVGRDAQSRGTETTYNSLQTSGFGVYAYLHSGRVDYETANFMENVKVSTANWTYAPAQYWPTNGDKIDFLAYGPHIASPSVDNGVLTYTIPTASESQLDLVVATAQTNKDKTEDVVEFTFKHTLSRIGFLVKEESATDPAPTITVKNATLTGKFNTQVTVSMVNGNVAGITPTAEQAYTYNGGGYMMLAPTDFTAGTDEVNVSVNYTIAYKDGKTISSVATGQIQPKFESGKAYTIVITLSEANQIQFSVNEANFGTWGGSSNVDVD